MMFQGTENVPGDFSGHFMEFGGEAGGMTSQDFTLYYDIIPSNFLERTLWLESDRLCNIAASIKQERLDNQRSVVMNERRQYLDNTPYSRMDEVMMAAAYPPDHPYSWEVVGRMEDLIKADTSALIEFARQYYSPNNAALIIVGDFNAAEAKQLGEKYFAAIPAGPPVKRVKQWIPELSETKRIVMQDNISMPRITMQWPSPVAFSEGDAEGIILGKCLSSGVSSRLYRALVDEAGLAVFVQCYQGLNELSGEFKIDVSARESQDFIAIEQIVDSVLTDIIENGVNKEEVEAVKKQIVKQRLDRLQSNFAMVYFMNSYNALLGDPDEFEWDADRILTVTPKGVQDFAKRYLHIDRRIIVECVPFGDIHTEGELPDWKTEPNGTEEPVFSPPDIQETTLPNGLKLMLIERHELPLVHANFFISVGTSSDPANRWGLATMVQALIDEGTKKRDIFQIEEELKQLGTFASTGIYTDGLTVSIDVLRDSFEPALEVVADMLMNSTFPQRELDNKKIKFTNVIRNNRFDPEVTVMNVFNREYFGKDSPFGQPESKIGTEASVQAVTRQELVDFYNRNFAPDNMTILLAGDMTLPEAEKIIKNAFGRWKPSGIQRPSIPAVPLPREQRKIFIVDYPEATQSMICIGNEAPPTGSPDYLACYIMSKALGAYEFDNRINKVVREEKGYSYGLGVGLETRRTDGMLLIRGKVDTEHTDESLQLIIKAMKDIAGPMPVNAEELAANKKTELCTFPSLFESNSDIGDMLLDIQLDGLPLNYWTTYLSDTQALDSAQVQQAAEHYLHPDKALIVIVGDRSKIEQPIRDLNLGEVSIVDIDGY
jgi:zinc protease